MNVIQETIGIPACFSFGEKLGDDSAAITRSGQSVVASVFRARIGEEYRMITVTWCKDLLLHVLSISIEGGPEGGDSAFKIEMKPWHFWKKQGSKRFLVAGKSVMVFWDLKEVKFASSVEPESEFYVAVVCDGEVALHLGNLRKEAYRKTGCRPSLTDPVLVSRKEHVFGRRKFVTRVKFQEKGSFHEICIEFRNRIQPEMEVRINGMSVILVKQLQWKFRGNQSITLNKARIEVYYDVHDWLFSPGLRHGLFIFKPTLLPPPIPSPASPAIATAYGAPDFSFFLYAWTME